MSRNIMMYGIDAPEEEKIKNIRGPQFRRNVAYYGVSVPIESQLPKVEVNIPMPKVKPPKEEGVTIESVKAAKELLKKAMKLDPEILRGYRDSIAISLLNTLEEVLQLKEVSDKLEWCLKRADRVIDLIFGESK